MVLFPEAPGLGVVASPRGGRRSLAVSLAAVVVAVGATLAGCGGGGQGTTDTVAPVITNVQGTFGDPSLGTLDLSHADYQRVIATATPLTLQVEVSDDVSSVDALTVQAVDGNGKPIAGQTAMLHNGLWEVMVTAQPGLSVHVAASDEAGNSTMWPYTAVFPTREQALVRQWTLLVYDSTGTVVSRPHDTLTATSWCQDDDAAGDGPAGGTWSVTSDGRLQTEVRGHMPCSQNPGSEGSTVESSRTGAFYVDATYFSDRPYQRQSGTPSSADLVGTWTRSADVGTGGATQTVTSSLAIRADNSFEEMTEDGHDLQGTYQIEQNTDYTNDFGNLLVLTTNKKDGAAVTPTTTVHYWRVTDGQLLVDPFVEVQ